MGTLLLVHAHPDDEAISTGGVMMKAKAHGHRVVNITATRGEAGEIYNMDEAASRPRLGEIRTDELKTAGEILGVDRQEFLGYRDSGMVDTPDNKDPRSFHQADLGEAAGRLAVLMREERPDVVVTYAEDGVYGHPDHIKAHFVTNAALDMLEREGLPAKKLYYTAIPRSGMEEFMKQMPEEARRMQNPNMRFAGTPDEAPGLRGARQPKRSELVVCDDGKPDLRAGFRYRVFPARSRQSGPRAARTGPLRGDPLSSLS